MNKRKTSKSSTTNLFNRYVWLVDLIYRRKKITYDEINEHWQRSTHNETGNKFPSRTFDNHKRAIEEMFDIIIECDKRDGYRYYIENADDMERGGARSWLINTFAVNNLINESHKIKQRILFEKIPSGQMYLIPIIEAMRDNLSLEITYQNFHGAPMATFEIFPYCVKVFKQRWYVVAYNPEKKNIAIYSLDRIKEMTTINNPYVMPEDFDGEEFFRDCFGIIAFDDTIVENVILKVWKNQDNYIRALPLHHSQKEIESTDEYSVFSYHIRPTFDFLQEILSHGDLVEVLEPVSLREEVANIIASLTKIYC
ncbi:WYL domain-containing protein [Odoribacter sp. OttesenSCG-928-L07]|nr:WYL domain-containing protein [Odoribacter sp. OttesenSCG-928-L07]MDL2239900.1 WYL domain-containing protein [Bacteroidales bacterium OttesenSCG-928-L14]MDL2241209.1 WYL domain-containing protein [Bacteroidales bacterium OttesenSCG-928-K22]